MSEKPVGSMNRQELVDLVKEIYDSSNTTQQRVHEIDKVLSNPKVVKFMTDTSEYINKIEKSLNDTSTVLNATKKLNEDVTEGNKNYSLIREDLDRFKGNINECKNILRDAEQEHKELFEKFRKHEIKLDDIEKKHQESHVTLYNSIAKNLLPGVTASSLATVFNEKANEFKTACRKWQSRFTVVLISAIVVTILGFSFYVYTGDIEKWLLGIPTYGFLIWMAIFCGNRRAENAKLEEIYKHKEVMAKTFFGYKKSIEELSANDKNLLIKHMENLLEAIKENPSNILNSKGEGHPITDIIRQNK